MYSGTIAEMIAGMFYRCELDLLHPVAHCHTLAPTAVHIPEHCQIVLSITCHIIFKTFIVSI